MKITIDTDTTALHIEKHGEPTTWGRLPYSERMRLLARISEVYFKLSEKIRK